MTYQEDSAKRPFAGAERKVRRRAVFTAVGVALCAPLLGCDSLLEVERAPNTVLYEETRGESGFGARLVGVRANFADAVAEPAAWGGLFSDELDWGSSSVSTDQFNRRIVDIHDPTVLGRFENLQVPATLAKELQADILDGAFEGLLSDPTNSKELALVSFISGHTRALIGEWFCTSAFMNTGPEYSSAQVLELAVADYTLAIEADNAAPEIRNAALVGRARARLNLGQKQAAAADAALVPAGFEYFVEYSGNTDAETNDVWDWTWNEERHPVAPVFFGLTIDGTGIPDPRVEVVYANKNSLGGQIPLYLPVKYELRSSPLRIASWEEAQLIIAEADPARAPQIINTLRAARGITQTYDPGAASTEEVLSKVRDERSRFLFLEGHRTGDLRRYLDQYGVDLFPTGTGYGNATCLPIPDQERRYNPGLQG